MIIALFLCFPRPPIVQVLTRRRRWFRAFTPDPENQSASAPSNVANKETMVREREWLVSKVRSLGIGARFADRSCQVGSGKWAPKRRRAAKAALRINDFRSLSAFLALADDGHAAKTAEKQKSGRRKRNFTDRALRAGRHQDLLRIAGNPRQSTGRLMLAEPHA